MIKPIRFEIRHCGVLNLRLKHYRGVFEGECFELTTPGLDIVIIGIFHKIIIVTSESILI